MDNVKISLAGQFELTDLRARIDSNVVMLPIASEIKYINEDGLSFGYPIDFGWVTNVDYQPVLAHWLTMLSLYPKL